MRQTILISRRQICINLAALSLLPITSKAALAKKPEIFTRQNLAIGGYDPLAYFVSEAPQKGSKNFTLDYKGAKWRFANAENLEAFRKNLKDMRHNMVAIALGQSHLGIQPRSILKLGQLKMTNSI